MGIYDLVVIGGGLVGSAVAWGASRVGARVALVDEGDVAFRASRGNFGLVWIQGKGAGMPPYAQWSRRSADLWPVMAAALAAETGVDVALEQRGGLYFCLSEAEMADRAGMIRRMHNEGGGNGTRLVERDEARRMVPGLGDRVVGASFCPIDGQANPLFLMRALHAALDRAGGAYLPGWTVDRIDGGDSFTVHAGSHSVRGRRLVIAAGLGSRRLAPMVGLDMPVSPLRGQIVVTEKLPRMLDYATHTVRQTADGGVMLGDSQEDVGFDTGVTASAMQDIAARNLATFPMLRDATVIRVWGALRVMSPDGFPIYAQSATHPGAFAVTCHSGVTLAGAHALELAPAILAGALPDTVAAFHPRRFATETACVA